MATSGCPWKCDKKTIIRALKSAKGRISHACKTLDVSHNTLVRRIRENEDLVEMLDDMRNGFNESLLDNAEDTLAFALNQKIDDLPQALKSSFYILNNKGEKRGYSAKNNPNAQTQGITLDDLKNIAGVIEDSEKVSGTSSS